MVNTELCLLSSKLLHLCFCRTNPANPRISAALLWVQLGKELQHPHWADYEAEYQHMLLYVYGKLHELDTVGMREQMEQQLQQWFPECW